MGGAMSSSDLARPARSERDYWAALEWDLSRNRYRGFRLRFNKFGKTYESQDNEMSLCLAVLVHNSELGDFTCYMDGDECFVLRQSDWVPIKFEALFTEMAHAAAGAIKSAIFTSQLHPEEQNEEVSTLDETYHRFVKYSCNEYATMIKHQLRRNGHELRASEIIP